MSSSPYDIAIIGAGPAGAALARLLSPRHRVLLVDRRNLGDEAAPAVFRKACGGLVAPDAQAMLARFGLGLPQQVLAGPQLFVVRTLDLETELERDYQRFYFNVDRERFDRWLVSLAGEHVERRFCTEVRDIRPHEGGFALTLLDAEGRQEIQARVLVGADGARSRTRALLVPEWPHAPAMYLGVQAWFEADTPPPHFSVAFDARLTDFYAWTIPKGNSVLLGAALPPGPEARQRFETFKARLAQRGFEFGRLQRREAHPILRPGLFTQPPRTPDQVLLIGEAGGFISPSSAEGFSYAFKSALAAAEVLNQGLETVAPRFLRAAAPLRTHLRGKNLKAPFMYQPWLRRLVMATGLRHLSRVDPR